MVFFAEGSTFAAKKQRTMKKRLIILCGFLCLLIGSANAQNNAIKLERADTIPEERPRSLIEADYPTAFIEDNVLTLNFTSAAAIQVAIERQHSHQVVYSDSFASTTQLVIDLENEGIGEGSYFLWLYAFGKWWIGEFDIEEQ